MAACKMDGDQNAPDYEHDSAKSPVIPRTETVNWPRCGSSIKSNNRRIWIEKLQAIAHNIAIDSGSDARWDMLLDGMLPRSTRDTQKK